MKNQENQKNAPLTAAENQNVIDSHKKAANHLESAAKHHIEAAKHQEEGNHEKAAKSTITAHGHTNLAVETQKENLKKHALKD
jgi:hypothetical protein